ncbi:MAG: ABC transporter permease [Bacilli bacterium]
MELRSYGDVSVVNQPPRSLTQRLQRLRSRWMMWMLLIPVAGWMIVFFAFPQLLMLFISFMSQGVYGGVVYRFTLDNYIQMFSPVFLNVIWTSVEFSFVVTVLCLAVAYPFAYAVATASPRRRMFLLFLVIIPFWTSQLIRTFALMFLINTSGLLNTLLLRLHVITQPLNLLYTPFAVYLGQFYAMLPYMILPLYASLQSHLESPEFLEAAQDLGASPAQAFWKITLPLTTSGIAVGAMLVFIPTLATFFIPLLMGGGKMEMVGNFIGNQFLSSDNWPFGASASVGVIAITLVLIALMFRFMKNAFLGES